MTLVRLKTTKYTGQGLKGRSSTMERNPKWTGEYFPGSAEKNVYENVQEIISASRLIKMGNSLGVREELRRLIPRSPMEELYEPPLDRKSTRLNSSHSS